MRIPRRRTLLVLAAVATLAACAGVLGLRQGGSREPSFPHRAHVTAGVSCVRCHTGILTAGDTGPLHLPDEASCLTCHDKPHDPNPCFACHGSAVDAAAAMEARAHLTFAHRDHQQVAAGNCMRCHQGVAEGDRRLRPQMATCWGCHEHDRAREIRDCKACHVDLAEEGVPPPSHLVHDGDFVRDHGAPAAAAADLCATCHGERFCATCHGVTVPVVPARMNLADPLAPSVHRAGFRSRHADEAQAAPGTCTSCHQPERCTECHMVEGIAGPGATSPHPARWVGLTAAENEHGRAARRDPAACASCHGGAGEALCVSCHRVGGAGGNPHPPGWDSRLPLTAMPCRMCHTTGARP